MNNYPSIPRRATVKGPVPLRANAHLDTSLLTVLKRRPSDGATAGALEIFRDGRWLPARAQPAWDTYMSARLLDRVLHLGQAQGRDAPHRVSLPPKKDAEEDSRRQSATFVLKPDYTARAQPTPDLARALGVNIDDAAPIVGLVGRVGWQNYQLLQDAKLTKRDVVVAFKPWKNTMRANLGLSANKSALTNK
jgi:isopenicillin N synthase-like dioxygenase